MSNHAASKPAQVGLQRSEQAVVLADLQQEGAHIHQELAAVRNRCELRQQLQPRRLQRLAQVRGGGGAVGRIGGLLHLGIGVGDGVGI